MRDVLRQELGTELVPSHLGLAYEVWAPINQDGKVPDEERDRWFGRLEQLPGGGDLDHYREHVRCWQASFDQPGDRLCEVELRSRLLIGHGLPSATDVGLTVHRTWGLPILPGSALKGLLAHYVDIVYGPPDAERNPTESPQARPPELDAAGHFARRDFQGVTWDGPHIVQGPGCFHRALFGAPPAPGDPDGGDGATRGLVMFHDALYVPGEADRGHPFAQDVLTVHQKDYYNAQGQPSTPWPNDHDDPNPVAFLSVKPGCRFLVALSGPAEWTELAEQLLLAALQEWGIGGKTAAGYGRAERVRQLRPDPETSPPPARSTVDELTAWLAANRELSEKQVVNQVKEQWLDRLAHAPGEEQERAYELLKARVRASKNRDALKQLLGR